MISIIIPFFNSEKTLGRAINSVIAQTCSYWELILVNDGSLDSSEEIAMSFLDDPRVSYFHHGNKGVSSARNFGASKAKGDWIIFLDSDDELVAKSHVNYSDTIIFFGLGKDIIESSYCLINEKVKENLQSARIPGSYCFKKKSFFQIGGFDEKMSYGENSELFRRAKQNGLKIHRENFVSVNYYESTDGGSKNLPNLVKSNLYLLNKYSEYFQLHQKEKAIYLQVIGVVYLRLGEFHNAKFYLWSCIQIQFYRPVYWIRYLLAKFPFLSKKIYPIKGTILR